MKSAILDQHGLPYTKSASVQTSAELYQELHGNGDSIGSGITSKVAMQQGAVFQCVRVLAESIGSMPVSLHNKTGNIRTKATDHAVHKLIRKKPNDFQTPVNFWEMVIAHLCYRGNFTAKIVRSGNREKTPLELIPIFPDRVTRSLSEDYKLQHHITNGTEKADTFGSSDIFHVKLFSFDGINGVNPIEYARNSIGLSKELEKHGGTTFKNGARPGGVLSTDARIDKAVAEEYRENWEKAHGGDKSGGTAVLGNGLKYQAIGMTSTDGQWLESRNYQKSDIAAFFRVPPHKINQLERSTNNNIEHQGLEFVTDSLTPYAVRIEEAINASLVSEADRDKGFYSKYNFGALLRGDMKARADYYSKQVNIGVLSPNEVRELEDRNPREGGDDFLTPLNMAVNGQTPEQDDE